MIKTTFIPYITLLVLIVVGVFLIRISVQLEDNQTQIKNNQTQTKQGVQSIEEQVSCIASYFNMQNRTGDTVLNCGVK